MNAPHVCTACDSILVQPTAWEESDDERFWLTLRCPECETITHGEFGPSAIEALEAELERGELELELELDQLVRANMAEFVDRFVCALEADAIQPMDF